MNMRQYMISSMNNNGEGLKIKDIQNTEQVKSTVPDNLAVFTSTVKIEQTRDGPRVEVRVYDVDDDSSRNRSVQLYKKTIEKLHTEGLV